MEGKIEVFIIFEKEDRRLFLEFKQHLVPLEEEGLITVWDEDQIVAGSDRSQAIAFHLHSAPIVLLLVSARFMASHESYSLAKQALATHTLEGYVVPVLLHKVDWEHSDFGTRKPLPANTKPISSWQSRDEAFLNVVQGIRAIVKVYKQSIVRQQVPSHAPQQPKNPSAYGSLQSGNLPHRPLFVAQLVKPKGKARLIAGIVVAILAIIIVGGAILASQSTSTGSPRNTVASTPTATPTPIGPTTPSGNPIDPAASSIVTNIQMASSFDKIAYQPIILTTRFKISTTFYTSFQLNLTNIDVSQENPGYVEAKYYIQDRRIFSPYTVKVDDTTERTGHGYFPIQYQQATIAGAVELYWCRNANCSDEKLAQTTAFTVY